MTDGAAAHSGLSFEPRTTGKPCALWCATTNAGKLQEFRIAGERFGNGRFSVEPLPGLAAIDAPEETGTTFEQNAILKAVSYSQHAAGYLFADDSGLEVTALGGDPGVYSARFAGPAASDEANNALVLEKLRRAADRTGQFVCVIALARDGKLVKTFRGEVRGEVAEAPRGPNGFGYDPLFFYPPFGCTFGEAALERKMEVSHRARALEAMFGYLAR
ncbi:MAG: RdgB/HAM1 family non-canonical purine NTP pyrophosphatase [Bryobacteraceae bacterium]